jgi:hypothetical protein
MHNYLAEISVEMKTLRKELQLIRFTCRESHKDTWKTSNLREREILKGSKSYRTTRFVENSFLYGGISSCVPR